MNRNPNKRNKKSEKLAVSTNKNFSHYNNSKEIENFVEENTNEEKCCFFILNQDVNLIDLIEKSKDAIWDDFLAFGELYFR